VNRFTAPRPAPPHDPDMSTQRVALDHAELTSNSPDRRPQRSWGWVSARPSEFLVVYRGGALSQSLSRQGGRFFKWPSDSYVVVPTTLKEVVFHASQVTTDFVDVKVRGMVVYRVAEPLRIYRLINFADRPAAEAKLAQMISDLCRSLAKWLVANLRLEECVRRRKEEIAGALAREVGEIATDRWGVEIVTVDVQDVFIQDEALFSAMQAGFRAEKEREARLARLEAERGVETRRIANERALEQDRQELALERARQAEELERRRLLDAEERARIAAEGELQRARLTTEARRLQADEELRVYRERLAAEGAAAPASLERLFVSEALPRIAEALTTGLEGARLHVFQAGEGAAGFLPLLVRQVMDLARRR
jgi:flotillin